MTLVKPLWTIGAWTAGPNYIDQDGTLWLCNADSGWFSPVGVRNYDTDRPDGDGTYSAPNQRTARVITISGYLRAATTALADTAVDQFNALLSGSALQTLTVTEENRTLSAAVKLGQGSDLARVGPTKAEWQLVMIAPDPRKYGAAQSTVTGLPSAISPGVDWTGGGAGGADWTGAGAGGLDWGTPGSSGLAVVSNPGSAPAWPTFSVAGPVTNPSITDSAGNLLAYTGSLGAGDSLTIVSSPYGPRTVRLNATAYVRAYLSTAQWASIPARSSTTYQFQGASTGSPSLTVSVAPAYW